MNQHKKLPACLYFVPFCLTIFLLLTFSGSSAETERNPSLYLVDTLPPGADSSNHIYTAKEVDIEPSFKNGLKNWWKFLERNLNGNTPVENSAPAGRYTVVIEFIVNKDGTLSDLKPISTEGYGMEQEVIRILRKSPPWEPAMRNGRIVNSYRKQPVFFDVSVQN